MDGKKLEGCVLLRDGLSMATDGVNLIIESMEPKDDEIPAAVSEANFDLKTKEYTSQKLGTFEVAEEKGNIPEKWNRAFNILKNANATISSRYHGEKYTFSYWIYNSRIYRQKLKK